MCKADTIFASWSFHFRAFHYRWWDSNIFNPFMKFIVGTTSKTKMHQIGENLNKETGRSRKKKRIKRNVFLAAEVGIEWKAQAILWEPLSGPDHPALKYTLLIVTRTYTTSKVRSCPLSMSGTWYYQFGPVSYCESDSVELLKESSRLFECRSRLYFPPFMAHYKNICADL